MPTFLDHTRQQESNTFFDNATRSFKSESNNNGSAISSSESKLLQKILQLSQMIVANKKFPNMKHSLRLKILLFSFLKITKKLNIHKFIALHAEKYFGWFDLLAHFPFDRSIILIKDSRWIAAVRARISKAIKKNVLDIWKKNIIKLFTKYNVSSSLLPNSIQQNRHGSIERRKECLIENLKIWRSTCRSKMLQSCKLIESKQTIFKVWNKCSKLSKLADINSQHDPFGISQRALFAWRSQNRVLKYNRKNNFFLCEKALIFWREKKKATASIYEIADTYRNVRLLRPAFYKWHARFRNINDFYEQAASIDNAYIKRKYLEEWQNLQQNILIRNKFWGKWRSLKDKQNCMYEKSQILQRKQLITRYYSIIKRSFGSCDYLRSLAIKIHHLRSIKSGKFHLTVWRKMLDWIVRNSGKVRTIRAAKDAKWCLDQWKSWREIKQTCNTLHASNVKKSYFSLWSCQLQGKKRILNEKSKIFSKWIRSSLTRRTMNEYKTVRLSREGSNARKMLLDANDKSKILGKNTNLIEMFAGWRQRAALNKNYEVMISEKEKNLKKHILKGWRMDANVKFYLRQLPWRLKRKTFRKIKEHKQFQKSRLEKLADISNELCEDRIYRKYHVIFGHWQQLFQARKMEEHLCSENFKNHQRDKKRQLLTNWKLTATLNVLKKCKDNDGKKQIFRKWYHSTQEAINDRKLCIIKKYSCDWRRSLRSRYARQLNNHRNMMLVSNSLVAWHKLANGQRLSHNRSIEFIGHSWLKYAWQKWRMQTVVSQSDRFRKVYWQKRQILKK